MAADTLPMQAGEHRLAQRLQSHLDDDHPCWYESPVGIGNRRRYSDFVLLHPTRGLLLLEVKDWKLETLHHANTRTVTLRTNQGLKACPNPLEQVRQCAYGLKQQLENHPRLVASEGQYRGHLLFPYGYGVVLTQITRQAFEESGLAEVLPEKQTLCKDEMQPDSDPQAFQERLARGLGGGHRVVHGVAGSGKTLILAYRCAFLAPQARRPILVVTYNIALANRLKEMVAEHNRNGIIRIHHFHRWCMDQLTSHGVAKPPSGHGFYDNLVDAVATAMEQGQTPKEQYDAAYIAHLFQQIHHQKKMSWSDMCVTYRSGWMGKVLDKHFRNAGIPCQWLNDASAKKAFEQSSQRVTLMTLHSSKGLEFPMVAVSGIGNMPAPREDEANEARLLYVAMTRSSQNLLLTGSRPFTFMDRLMALANTGKTSRHRHKTKSCYGAMR